MGKHLSKSPVLQLPRGVLPPLRQAMPGFGGGAAPGTPRSRTLLPFGCGPCGNGVYPWARSANWAVSTGYHPMPSYALNPMPGGGGGGGNSGFGSGGGGLVGSQLRGERGFGGAAALPPPLVVFGDDNNPV